MVAKHDSGLLGCKTAKHYAITPAFVTKYMSFGEQSIVFVNACSSFDPDFSTACLDKGASVYAGWTQPVGDSDAYRAAKYLFDRMLGANAYVQDPEDPPQRPFTHYELIVGPMHDLGYDMSGTSQLITAWSPHEPDGPRFGLLNPSIFITAIYDSLEQPAGELVLNGTFGAEGGKVFVGGVEMTVTFWEPDEIRCQVPYTGPGSAGDIVVEVDGRRSNAKQLTQWRRTLTFTEQGPGSLHVVVTGDVHFRADVTDARLAPHVAPETVGSRNLIMLPDSSATVEASGAYEYQDGDTTVEVTWSTNGSNELPMGQRPGRSFFFLGLFETEFRVVVFDIVSAGAANFENDVAAILETVTRKDAEGQVISTTTETRSFWMSASIVETTGTELTLDIDETYNILSGGAEGDDHGHHYILEWDTIQATFPPDPAGARSL